MTTIVGVKTNFGEDLITLVADRQLNMDSGPIFFDSPGESKLYAGDDFAIGITGPSASFPLVFIDYLKGGKTFKEYHKFLTAGLGQPRNKVDIFSLEQKLIRSGRRTDPIKRAIESGHFLEFEMLNRYFLKRKKGDNEYLSEMLFAANGNGLMGLYFADFSGNVHRVQSKGGVEYKAIGSGSSGVKDYIETHEREGKVYDVRIPGGKVDLGRMNRKNSILFADRLIDEAKENDEQTGGGSDFIIVGKDRVVDYGDRFKEAAIKARSKEFQAMIKGI